MMNREQKISFIKYNHPKLYKMLEEKVKPILSDSWVYSQHDVDVYNETVIEYCKNVYPEVMKMLVMI